VEITINTLLNEIKNVLTYISRAILSKSRLKSNSFDSPCGSIVLIVRLKDAETGGE